MNVARHIGAVLAGLLATLAVTTVTDVVCYRLGLFHAGDAAADAHYVLAVFYRIVYGVAGAWLTARLAPSRPVRDALVLGGIGTALGIVGTVTMWSLGHHWYPIVVSAICLPCAWLGARLHTSRTATRALAAA